MPDDIEGGDPACWLDRLCPECGAVPTAEPAGVPTAGPARCWRCGAELPGPGPG